MKMIKMALLAGAAVAVSAAAAQAEDLDALKAQIEALNARVAAMETAPSVPAGYQLIAVSEGELQSTPGLDFTARERAAYGNKATVISVLPTADAPAGTTITWSGFARAGLVHQSVDTDREVKVYRWDTSATPAVWNDLGTGANDVKVDDTDDDTDVKARAQLRVQATTDTAVGEVGVDIRMRANFNGNGQGDVYSDVAWGYWAMTPEMTFGGGYAGSLGNIGYGYDGACTCNYTDNADLAFDPGDVTQMRLAYASGPLSMAIALEDGSTHPWGDKGDTDSDNGEALGAAGEIKYSGDMFSGEISAVWREVDEQEIAGFEENDTIDSTWQVGAGIGFALGEIANLSFGAAMGEGPASTTTEGVIDKSLPYNQSWWGVSALASFNLSDEFRAELAAGYKKREGDDIDALDESALAANTDDIRYTSGGFDADIYGVMGGLYYEPVDQLTIGVEAEWYTTEIEGEMIRTRKAAADNSYSNDLKGVLDSEVETLSVNLVSVWRF